MKDYFLNEEEEEKDKAILIYAKVPIEIYKTKKLTYLDKLIAERITALTYQKGYCWISNKALSLLYGANIKYIEQSIQRLKKIGYIKAEYTKIEGKSQRKIYLTEPTKTSASTRQIRRETTPLLRGQPTPLLWGHNIKSEYKKEYIIIGDKKNPIFNENIKSKPMTPEEMENMKNLLADFK